MGGGVQSRHKPIGATIGLFFGGLWCFLGAQAIPQSGRMAVAAAGFAITALLILMVWRKPLSANTGAIMFGRRAYFVAVGLEVLAIVAAANLLPRYGLDAYFIPVLGIVVGLHFIGLWVAAGKGRAARSLLWIAGAMCIVSALSALLPTAYGGFNPRDAACCFATALVLWIGASRRI